MASGSLSGAVVFFFVEREREVRFGRIFSPPVLLISGGQALPRPLKFTHATHHLSQRHIAYAAGPSGLRGAYDLLFTERTCPINF